MYTSISRPLWPVSTPSTDGSHHIITSTGMPLYPHIFQKVLPFHPPGFAPVTDHTGSYHINEKGEPIYSRRFKRTFGFYEGLAAIIDHDGSSYHIKSDGECAYLTEEPNININININVNININTNTNTNTNNNVSRKENSSSIGRESEKPSRCLPRFDWCGNFQQGRCVIRTSSPSPSSSSSSLCHSPPQPPSISQSPSPSPSASSSDNSRETEYYHIRTDGSFIGGGPYAYAGDYREGSAVVRDRATGLCHHVDLHGERLYEKKGFHDLDVFHKGFARAKDSGGWFHIDEQGQEISSGNRYSNLEPFYNGMAFAQFHNGRRVVIDESNMIATTIRSPQSELHDQLHSMFVQFWPPFAVKLGLEMGIADEDLNTLRLKLPLPSFKALQAAWIDLGLLSTTKSGGVNLTEMGKNLRSGLPDRDRADYWLGIQMKPWLEASQRFLLPPSQETGNSFFMGLNRDSVDLCQRVLYSYAQSDWAKVAPLLDLTGVKKVVDIGGGFGFLAQEIKKSFPRIECLVVEKPEVVLSYKKYVTEGMFQDAGVPFIDGDLFSGHYPDADMYILSRILHDWSDSDVLKILLHLASELPPISSLVVIDQIKQHEGAHGLLQLNMLLVNGGTERSTEEFDQLFIKSGWIRKTKVLLGNNRAIMQLHKMNSNNK